MTSKIKDFYGKHIVENLESSGSKDGKDKKKGFVVWKLRSILLAFLLIWGLSAVLIYLFFDSWGDRGTFGDMFGAINALFSAFAFGGLVYTLYVQRYELSLQRKELALQRKEVSRNADQLEEQKNVMIQQSFENTLFKMIELHHNIIDSLRGSNDRTGRTMLGYIRIVLREMVFNSNHENELRKKVQEFMEGEVLGKSINHYLKNFHCILLLIDKHCSNTKEKVKDSDYATIALSQLSDDERYIIFYALGYREETRLLLEKFIDLQELNQESKHHLNFMRRPTIGDRGKGDE
ncbi:putative phage abortive infection protein [Paenibacillus sp. Y5S-9]|uniref:putative phage abortive infection protein n=1 Tax=Paenibacillus sp. Y5S-9 TaxID=3122489 RepID=UPI0030D3F1CB